MRYVDAITARKVPGPVETKADPFTLASLIAWLEQQPGDEVYCYVDPGHCLLARYFKARGFKVHGVGAGYIRLLGDESKKTPLSMNFEDIAVDHPRTFGGALARARKLALVF